MSSSAAPAAPAPAATKPAAVAKVAKEPPKSFARRDALRSNELAVQAAWASTHEFETDAPVVAAGAPAPPKFFCTFPYPYMNGRLHLGHAFSLSKAEFAAGYYRMMGRQVLFPFAFHCTGMPIHAAAQKLKREIASGSYLKKAVVEEEAPAPAVESAPAPAAEAAAAEAAAPAAVAAPAASKAPGAVFHGKKSKVAAKTGAALSQWDILSKSGSADADIPAFQDSRHWLDYFPSLGGGGGGGGGRREEGAFQDACFLSVWRKAGACAPPYSRRAPACPSTAFLLPRCLQARRTSRPLAHTSTGAAPSSRRPSTPTTTPSSAGRWAQARSGGPACAAAAMMASHPARLLLMPPLPCAVQHAAQA